MAEVVKRYKNDEIILVWQAAKCIHSENCFHGLPGVFNPENRPWIQMSGADTENIVKQVKHCPSGALSIEDQAHEEQAGSGEQTKPHTVTRITVTKGGPLLLEGELSISLADGTQTNKSGTTALCRCGASSNKPYCDGSHAKLDFDS